MVKPMEIIAHKVFGEWFYKIVAGVYLPLPQNIVGNIIPNKMLAKWHMFLV